MKTKEAEELKKKLAKMEADVAQQEEKKEPPKPAPTKIEEEQKVPSKRAKKKGKKPEDTNETVKAKYTTVKEIKNPHKK
jgi:hypothetical protein